MQQACYIIIMATKQSIIVQGYPINFFGNDEDNYVLEYAGNVPTAALIEARQLIEDFFRRRKAVGG